MIWEITAAISSDVGTCRVAFGLAAPRFPGSSTRAFTSRSATVITAAHSSLVWRALFVGFVDPFREVGRVLGGQPDPHVAEWVGSPFEAGRRPVQGHFRGQCGGCCGGSAGAVAGVPEFRVALAAPAEVAPRGWRRQLARTGDTRSARAADFR